MRFGRLAIPVFNDESTYKFELGKGVVLREGNDVAIFATGLEVYESMQAAEMLATRRHQCQSHQHPHDQTARRGTGSRFRKRMQKVVTVEEHSIIGGLGSAVCDTLCANYPTPVLKIGVNDVYGESGPAVQLVKKIRSGCREHLQESKSFSCVNSLNKGRKQNDFPLWFCHLESRFYFSVFRSVCVKYFLF